MNSYTVEKRTINTFTHYSVISYSIIIRRNVYQLLYEVLTRSRDIPCHFNRTVIKTFTDLKFDGF